MAYDWSGMDHESAFALVMQRSPEAFPVGIYTSEDVHHYFGGGTGALMWFSDEPECCAFIESVLVTDGRDGSTPEASAKATAVLGDGGLSAENLRALTALRLQQLAFEWSGTLADLEAGEGDFPAKVRGHFREDRSTGPLPASERAAFLAFLRGYGI